MRLRASAAAALLMLTLAAPTWASDPFDDARYHITIDDARVLQLVDSGKVSINYANAEGYTLLHYAADANRLQLVKDLLARGADANARAKSGSAPSDMTTSSSVKVALAAASSGPRPTLQGATANLNTAGPSAQIVSRPTNGMCAVVLRENVNDGRSAALRPVLRARDDIWYNHPEELSALLDDCVDANAKDMSGSTLLHSAAERDRVDMARILLAHGASKSVTDLSGKTPGAYASSPEMRALLGSPATPLATAASDASSARKVECQQKYQADVALAFDDTGRRVAQRKWAQCLKTGNYW